MLVILVTAVRRITRRNRFAHCIRSRTAAKLSHLARSVGYFGGVCPAFEANILASIEVFDGITVNSAVAGSRHRVGLQ